MSRRIKLGIDAISRSRRSPCPAVHKPRRTLENSGTGRHPVGSKRKTTNHHVLPELARGSWPRYIAPKAGHDGPHGTWTTTPMGESAPHHPLDVAALLTALGRRSIVLVGMMGAGKSSIGRRLAQRLGLSFVDADAEIESAAGMTIAEIFANYGEAYFRSGEQRVIARLLDGGPQVLATGGGAFMNPETRSAVAQKGVSVWLKAEF